MNSLASQYSSFVEFLGKTLGPDYEIVLHDVSGRDKSVVAIANGHISGRSVGAPITNFALNLIMTEAYLETDYVVDYEGVASENRRLRSSTFFIKGRKGNLIGLLCINFDDSRYAELSRKVLALCHPEQFLSHAFSPPPSEPQNLGGKTDFENFHKSVAELTADAIAKITADNSTPLDRLTQEEKMDIIGMLRERGVFTVKGAVPYVARQLSCSQASIYRYLQKLSETRG